ncbi:class I SAM-dependent methyltransferase [Fuscibacter oryzae]|uniref:SAM-dependent methyltransferase n=1 Tax=Fuscibacter oryzae TaxID=2803939 RepID=A0A8J7MQA7_9RHOB|nr:SAM-dependent methyltransferase [Fuscibacter oryzae]MBL4926954.1 SAM-dependent methyltransferase [Fuscibacter oryzae]
MTALADILKARIAATGPMRLSDYMAECLLNPQHGYYSMRDPFGTGGDFITAPEISQMFGELLGLALAQYWLDLGRPAPFTLAELGPGRGTLMADVLRATRAVPGFHAAAKVHLVEASATLRRVQRQTLGDHTVTWLDRAESLPQAPLFLLANEFFDALPIRQFTRDAAGWRETMVGLEGDNLRLGLSTPGPFGAVEDRLDDTTPGDVVEICPAAGPVMAGVGQRIAAHGGLAMIIDYGNWTSLGDTFQAMKAHRFTHPLAEPGEADLTAHVAFEPLADAALPANHAFVNQGYLLTTLGIGARADRLAQGLTGAALLAHQAATRRLTAPEEMGHLFKALAIFPPGAPLPPGFA